MSIAKILWKVVVPGRFRFWLTQAAALMSGGLIGMFLESGFGQWVVAQMEQSPLLSATIGPQGIVEDMILSSSTLMFASWGAVFLLYHARGDVKGALANVLATVLKPFASGPWTVISALGTVLLGVVAYAVMRDQASPALLPILIFGGVLLALGALAHSEFSLVIEGRAFLLKHSRSAGRAMLLAAAACWLLDVFYLPAVTLLDLWTRYRDLCPSCAALVG